MGQGKPYQVLSTLCQVAANPTSNPAHGRTDHHHFARRSRTVSIILTPKQREAIKLCAGTQRHTLLKGGARSGKTFIFVRNTVLRAIKAKESRHGIFRLASNACHRAIRLDTYAKVMRDCFPNVKREVHLQDGYDKLENGSEIWFAGLDDKERIEKILGMEFATLYLNEC